MEVITNLNYQHIEEIGRDGQNSRVFRAFDNYLHAELVVKEVERKRVGDPERYFTEARALHASAHPRVVPVRWAGLNDTHICIAMPLMTGGSLAQKICARPLRASEVIRIGQDLCEGVAQVHIARLVHLDIKPSNVLFDTDGRAALTDFGLALTVDAYGTADARDIALFPSYLPPEIVRHRAAVTPAADVYQIGLTLYTAANGAPLVTTQWDRVKDPWPSGPDAIREGRFPDRTFLPSVPVRLRQVLERALSVDPAHRQVGARRLAEELGAIDVKHDWEVEEYGTDGAVWRLRKEDRVDVLVLQNGAPPNAAVEIWTDSPSGRRRKNPEAWTSSLRTRGQLAKALRKALRAALV